VVGDDGALTSADLDRVAGALANSRAENTRRFYRSQWRNWERWAEARDMPSRPAEPAHVAAFLTDFAATRKIGTVRAALSAIVAGHRAAGVDDPGRAAVVRETMKGLANAAAAAGQSRQRQAKALDDAALAAIRATACKPRKRKSGSVETPEQAYRRGLKDIALCQTMRDCGLRSAEAAALTWADVEAWNDGTGRLHVGRSKTDQAGEGDVVAVSARAMRDLAAIRTPVPHAKVFGLQAQVISRRIKAAALHAGLGPGYSGHSGRVGLARRMVKSDAPVPTVMRQGRWKSTKMIASYTRNESAGEALKYIED